MMKKLISKMVIHTLANILQWRLKNYFLFSSFVLFLTRKRICFSNDETWIILRHQKTKKKRLNKRQHFTATTQPTMFMKNTHQPSHQHPILLGNHQKTIRNHAKTLKSSKSHSKPFKTSFKYSTITSIFHNTIQYNTIQYNTIQYNTIQYNKIQYNTIQYNTIQCNTIQYNTIQYNTIQYNTIQYNTIKYNTTQYNTIQYNTIQYKYEYYHSGINPVEFRGHHNCEKTKALVTDTKIFIPC